MIWVVIAAVVGLALGVGGLLFLAQPASLNPIHKRGPRKKNVRPRPVAPPQQVTPSHDSPPEVHRSVDFPLEVVRAAWRRQGGLCANCGRLLIWPHRNRDSGTGAWQTHHRTPRDQGGSSDLKNCVLLCSGIANCHFNIGHGAIGWNDYSPLEDDMLPFLRHGGREPQATASQTRTTSSLVGRAFGALMPARDKKPSASKPNANRRDLQLPYQDELY